MRCEDALMLISGHLDGANTPEEEQELLAHVSACEACRGVLSAFEMTDTEIAALWEPAPAGLCEDVMAQIKKESKKRKRRPWLGLAAAAALMLVIGVSAVVDAPEHTDQPQTVSASESYTVSRSVPAADPESLAAALAEERGAAVVLIGELLYEIETYPCQTLEEGYLLYVLPDGDLADELGEQYGYPVCRPDGASQSDVSYALLAP